MTIVFEWVAAQLRLLVDAFTKMGEVVQEISAYPTPTPDTARMEFFPSQSFFIGGNTTAPPVLWKCLWCGGYNQMGRENCRGCSAPAQPTRGKRE